MLNDYFYLDYVYEFFSNLLSNLFIFISENKLFLAFFLIPIAVSCIYVVIDFIFDVRDDFTEFNSYRDNFHFKYAYLNYKKNKQKQLYMDEIYQKSKENADYKHKLKIDELEYFRDSERIRHQNKIDEFNMYPNNSYKLTYDDFTPSEINQKGNDRQGFINYIKEFEPQYFYSEIRKQEKSALFDKYYTDKRIKQERENISAGNYQRKGIDLDIDVED